MEALRRLLQSLVAENNILQQETRVSSLNALTASLADFEDWKASDALYLFLDSCILRLLQKPIKYCGELDTIIEQLQPSVIATARTVSPLLVVLLEQWPFFIESNTQEHLANATEWLARYLQYSAHIGEDVHVLFLVKNHVSELSNDGRCKSIMEVELVKATHINLPASVRGMLELSESVEAEDYPREQQSRQQSNMEAELMLSSLKPPVEADDHPGLSRWIQKEIFDAVEVGAVGELLLCLCSRYEEIRKQALVAIRALAVKVEVRTIVI